MAVQDGYSRMQIGLHWLVLLLFTVNYVLSDGMGDALDRFLEMGEEAEEAAEAAGTAAALGLDVQLHVWVGITVLALTVLRLAIRLARGVPELPPGHALLNRLGHLGHLALYALLALLPFSGIMAWFGGFEAAGETHQVLVNLTLALIIVHAAAALFHQYVLKDGLLARMSPRRPPGGGA